MIDSMEETVSFIVGKWLLEVSRLLINVVGFTFGLMCLLLACSRIHFYQIKTGLNYII